MCKKRSLLFVLIGIILINTCLATNREVTLTIDDLPFVGKTRNDPGKVRRENRRFKKILEILNEYQVPATGFVIAGAIESGQWKLLQQFHQDGYIIGNHTYSHLNLSRTSSAEYIHNIAEADKILTPLLSHPKYFRYPFLVDDKGRKKIQVVDYLMAHDYIIVPVTIDSKDYRYNERLVNIPWRERKRYLKSIRNQYLSFIWRQTLRAQENAKKSIHRPIKQILMVHMNLLNAYFLGDIIKLFRQHGYHFISLPDALKDTYYINLTKHTTSKTSIKNNGEIKKY